MGQEAVPGRQEGCMTNADPTRPKLLVTRKLPAPVEQRICRDYDARLNADDSPYSGDELISAAAGCDGMLVCTTDRIDSSIIRRLPATLRVIATFSVGYDHIDVVEARTRGLIVTNTPGVVNVATAELTLLLMLGAARRASEGEALIRAGRFPPWSPTGMLGHGLDGRRLGLLGMGEVGRAVAARARAFGMAVHYHNRHRLPPDLEDGATYHRSVESLLEASDVLSLHCPSTPETREFLNARRIALLPQGAIVINAGRGDLVVDSDLLDALDSGRIAAAGLDVFLGEPDIDPRYRDRPNTFLLPHMGTSTVEARNAMGFRALDNLDAVFAGREPPDALT
jgi:lactate dehydrogenase-like 2-hydroxyacid dehydrogenase